LLVPAREVTHACPPPGVYLTPCCQATPFELPRTDRITTDPALVTCAGTYKTGHQGLPSADWGAAWAELTGYVSEAAEGGGTIDPASLQLYMTELRRRALAPVREHLRQAGGRR
jgi:hypothetical protein